MTFYANFLCSVYCKDYTKERIVTAHKRYLKENNLKTEGKYYWYCGEHYAHLDSIIVHFVQDNIDYEIAAFVEELYEPEVCYIYFGKTNCIFYDKNIKIDNIDKDDNVVENTDLDFCRSYKDDNYIRIGNNPKPFVRNKLIHFFIN